MRYFLIFLFALFAAAPVVADEKPAETQNAEAEKSASSPDDVIVDDDLFNSEAFAREVVRFEGRVREYQKEFQQLVLREVAEKRRFVESKYTNAISEQELKEVQARKDAIILFEEFIRKYPDNPKYTPNAMYRLAELYYERSMIVYNEKTEGYEAALEKFDKGEVSVEPELPEIDFSDSIRLYTEMIRRFPDFEYIGSVYYLLGYCYSEAGQGEKAVQVWLTLLEKGLAGENYVELRLRLGDYYFAENDLKKAEEQYLEGKKFPESNFYDQILYKLAWTYYRQFRLEDAVKTFTQLLFYSDEMKAQGVDKGQNLRKEAIQYIAISFADDEWGSADKAIAYFSGIKAESFEIDVFEQLGGYFDENNKYTEAEKVYRYIIGRYPYYENTPTLHNSLIKLCNKAREFDKAAAETEIFAEKYNASSEWARVNRGNPAAVRAAAELAKIALLDTAVFHHKQAQTLKENGDADGAAAEYRKAANFYAAYLKDFPYTSETYDITYSLADTLFYAGDIKAAVVVYEKVRDDKNQDKYRDDAAFQVFYCYNSIWEGSDEKNIPAAEKAGKPLSDLEQKLVFSSDMYLKLAKEVEDKPVVAYNVARIYYDHDLYSDAEPRYLRIISEFPETEPAVMASKDIIAYYTAKKDWVSVAKWSKVFAERFATKAKTDKKAKEEFSTYRASALFKHAQQLEEEGKHAEAAEEYLRMVEENPGNKDADKAIYNAAVNYSRATMFESALHLHERIYTEYPHSELAPQSLYLVAYNAEMSYDHEKAVKAYIQLYNKYPKYKEKSNAVFNAAFLLEKLQKYKDAARYYRLYYTEEKSKPEGKEALYDVGRMYQKAEDWKDAIKNYESFITTFENDLSVTHLVARARYQIAKIYEEKLNNQKMAKASYEKILAYIAAKKVTTDESMLYAAEAKFKLLEDEFNAYLKLKIIGKNDKQLEENLKKKVAAMKELEGKYNEVLKFQVYEWMMAGMYRIGFLYQSFSDALFDAEPPAGLSEEEEEIYTDMLKQQAEPIEEQAVTYYSKALEKAREFKVFNKWTQLITEKLAVMRPAEYKVGKTPIFAEENAVDSGFAPVVSLDKAEKKVYKKAGLGAAAEEGNSEQKDETPKEVENEKAE